MTLDLLQLTDSVLVDRVYIWRKMTVMEWSVWLDAEVAVPGSVG